MTATEPQNGKRASLLRRLSQPVDLTAGTPWRVILRYAVPIMISYLLQQIYVLTDAVICGQVLSAEEVAGVNDTFPLTFIFLQFAFGCTAGFSVLTAGCVGAGDRRGVRRSFAAQIYLSLGISVVLTVLSVVLLPWMLELIHVTPINKTVYDAAYIYCLVIFLGIFAQMGYNFICGILRSFGDSVTPLVFLVFSTLLNVGLDILFLVPFRMGPAGAAIAAVLPIPCCATRNCGSDAKTGASAAPLCYRTCGRGCRLDCSFRSWLSASSSCRERSSALI